MSILSGVLFGVFTGQFRSIALRGGVARIRSNSCDFKFLRANGGFRTLEPLGEMHATLTDTEVNGYFIPAGTVVLPNLYSVHMDPKTWSDPNEFRPERFLDANNSLILRDQIMPFSIGKRSCLGEVLARQELFVFLGALVQRFIIEPPIGVQKVDDTTDASRAFVSPPTTIQMRLLARQ
jgi:hypothetical protein